jgi:hypothetical protein
MMETAQCPMCPQRFEERTDLRVHLMCEHRKSAITDELLAAIETKHELYRELRQTPPVSVLDS